MQFLTSFVLEKADNFFVANWLLWDFCSWACFDVELSAWLGLSWNHFLWFLFISNQDESVEGILTILCNHSFHGSCLSKWSDTTWVSIRTPASLMQIKEVVLNPTVALKIVLVELSVQKREYYLYWICCASILCSFFSCPVCRYCQTPQPVDGNKCFECDSNEVCILSPCYSFIST